MKSKTDKIFEIVLVLVLVVLAFGVIYIYTHWFGAPELSQPVEISEPTKEENKLVVEKSIEPKKFQEEKPKEIILPETLNLASPPFRASSPGTGSTALMSVSTSLYVTSPLPPGRLPGE